MKRITSTSKEGVKSCQHWQPTFAGDKPSCLTCSVNPDDLEIGSQNGVVNTLICSQRGKQTLAQIKGLLANRKLK